MDGKTFAPEVAESASPPGHNSPSTSKANGQKRKRNTSSASHASDAEEHGDHQKKRACNECRQQKLKCNVVMEPYERCSRCQRLKLECRIDANFKRVGKRSKTAQMEREIVELRKRLEEKDSLVEPFKPETLPVSELSKLGTFTNSNDDATVPHQGVADSLLDLRHGTDMSKGPRTLLPHASTNYRVLGTTSLDENQIEELYKHYFHFYHPFLPVLDPDRDPDHYYELSPLLFWTVISVAARRFEDDPTLLTGIVVPFRELIWSTVSAVPQNYHVAKALALLCSWPLPTTSTSTDQTYLLSGLMMQIAQQTGLHRPSYAQDFSKTRVELKEEDVDDRLKTWAICNISVQMVSTGYGMPPASVYDYTLESLPEPLPDKRGLSAEIYWRLQIERFSNKVSQMLYNNKTDPIGIANAQERAAWNSLLIEDYRDLEQKIERHASPIALLHLQAAGLHLRLSAFFDSYSAPNYVNDLLQLYLAATTFLNSARQLDTVSSSLKYATRYIVHLILAGGFALMKLLNSFFARHIDIERSRVLFNRTIHGIRSISVANDDLPARLAEVLAQLWRSYGAGLMKTTGAVDSSLQLRVRRRMSMSLVYDSIWRWREEFQFKGDGTTAAIDSAVNNPTNPEDSVDSDAGQALTDPTLPDLTMPSAGLNDSLVDYNYEVFDPLTWMLDGSTGFPYNGVAMLGVDDQNPFD